MQQNRWIILGIALLALGFMGLDWSRLLLRPENLEVSTLSNVLKVGVSFLAAVIAWRARGHGLSARDERTFMILFGLVFVADVCFVVNLAPVGIVLFAIFQGMLAKRNLMGWREARSALAEKRFLLAGIAAAVAASLGATVYGIYALQGVTPLLFVIAVYVTFLWASVVAAWVARYSGAFPATNARLMSVGMLLFLFCDITVAGNLALPPTSLARVVTSSLTWMFYAPALVLIACSAWRQADAHREAKLPVAQAQAKV